MASLAARQHGVVSHPQLIECGVSASTITRWANSGRLHRVHRGVYAVGHRNLTREGTWMAAVLACGAGAALSHEPAGQLLYLVDRNERFRVHVSIPPGRTPRPPGVIVHRTSALDARDVTVRRQIPVTTPTRTAWDLAAGHSPKLARRAYERAEGTDNLDHRRMVELLSASPSRKGSRLIRELLGSQPVPLSEVRSWLEGLLLHLCAEHRLPFPEVNVPLLRYEVDFLWPQARFIVEADGSDHLDPSQRDSDNDRDFDLAIAGYLVRRYSYRAMGREAQVEAEVRSALAARLPRDS
jgi:very-short-patch-repair endonuclease